MGYSVFYNASTNTYYQSTEPEWVPQWKSPIGVHGGVRKAWMKGGIDGRPSTGGEMNEMHMDVTFAIAAFAASFTYLYFSDTDTTYSDRASFKYEGSGPGAQLSYALHPFLSIDAMYARVSGPLEFSAGMTEMSSDMDANRIQIGTTIRGLPIIGVKLALERVGGVTNLYGQDMTWGAWGFSVEGLISLF